MKHYSIMNKYLEKYSKSEKDSSQDLQKRWGDVKPILGISICMVL